MGMQWQALLGCLCVLAFVGALPTPDTDTMVVSKTTDGVTEDETTTPVADVTTSEPVRPVKLTEMEVTSNVFMRYAHTAVVAHVRNPSKRAQEATFRVLLPETAFISGFIMTLDGKSYKAYVKKKEEAKQIYDQAVAQGLGAAHIATKARDSNHFTVSVNVEANTAAIFNLTYEELLVRRNGVYNHAINLHPGTLVPKLTVNVNIRESEKITVLRVPEVRTGNEIDATAEDPQNTKAVITRGHDDREATVTFKPDIEEQKRLIAVYMEKAKKNSEAARRYPGEATNENEGDDNMVLGQFVVQYDVSRPKNGEILVNDGYFVHFFAPTDLPPLNKHVVFVLDTSGSMMDRKIVQLRQAMQTILSDLNPGDYFNIVEFDSNVKVHELKEADEEPKQPDYSYYWSESRKPVKLVAPSPATPVNIGKAKVIVSRLQATGGTNIDEALNVAVQLMRKGTYPVDKKEVPTSTTAKADSVTVTTTVAPTTEEPFSAEDTEAFEKAAKLEPIIIFLTDGDPTVGETDPKRIINHLIEKNYGDNKATIFSLAFGEDADRKFLRKISLLNDGFMRHIYEASDAALQLRDFYRQVSSPLLADVKFVYPPDQVKADSLTKHKFRTYYAGSETVVAGRVEDAATELTPQLLAFCLGDDAAGRKKYEVLPKAPVERKKNSYLPLERLWAYLTVKQLLDERDALVEDVGKDDEKSPEKKALDVSLKYELVTPLTSLVVVKPNATDAVNAESVDKADHGYPMAVAAGQPLSSNFMISGQAGIAGPVFDDDAQELQLESEDYIDTNVRVESVAYSSVPQFRYNSMVQSAMRFSFHDRSVPGSAFAAYPAPSYHAAAPGAFGGGYYRPAQDIVANHYPQVLTTPAPAAPFLGPPTTSLPLPPPPPPQSTLQTYHLEEYKWAEPLLDSALDSLVLHHNNTTKYLKLSANDTIPQDPTEDTDCANGQDGAKGLCVYLSRCDSARDITQEIYTQTYCIVDSSYAGVCCPKTSIGRARA